MVDSNEPQNSDTVSDLGLEGFANPDDEQGLSLDELSQAYATLLERGEDPYQEDAPDLGEASIEDDVGQPASEDADRDEQSELEVTPSGILEAVLFVGTPDNTPLTTKQIASMMRGVRPQEVDELIVELNEQYESLGRPYTIVSEGPGYRMVLSDEFASLRNKFYGKVKEARLSQAAIDVLSIVAYNQPLSRVQVDEIRGKPSGGLLSQLVRRQLLGVQRTDTKPRQTLYSTTERFLALFGLTNLEDLPRSQDLDRVG